MVENDDADSNVVFNTNQSILKHCLIQTKNSYLLWKISLTNIQ